MKSLLLCSALGLASTILIGWRIHAVHNRETRHFEIVEDLSLSHPNGCESLLSLADRVFRSDGLSRESTLTVLIVGDAATANEPWQLGRYEIPTTLKVIEGRKKSLQRETDIVGDISSKCQTARRTNISPVFLAIKRAVADLRAEGCKETSHCELFVDSDLEENVEPSIKRRLDRSDGRKQTLPTSINNSGVHVTFCGLAVTSGRLVSPSMRAPGKVMPRGASGQDQLQKAWLSLLTRPELSFFEPYCRNP